MTEQRPTIKDLTSIEYDRLERAIAEALMAADASEAISGFTAADYRRIARHFLAAQRVIHAFET